MTSLVSDICRFFNSSPYFSIEATIWATAFS